MRALKFTAVLLVLAVCLYAVAADKSDARRRGENKLERLLKASKKRSPLLNLGSGQFIDYAQQGPRPYSLVLFLTQGGGSCQMCDEVEAELKVLADAYQMARYKRDEEGEITSDDELHRVFFLKLDAGRNYQLFKEMGLKTIPHIVYVPPTKKSKKRGWDKLFADKINFQYGFKAEELMKMLFSRTKVKAEIVREPEPVDYTSIVFTLLSGIFTIGFFMTVGRPFVDQYFRNRNIYMVLALLIYAYCTSGSMYNYIRNTQFMHRGSDPNDYAYISPGSGNQFGAESWIVGTINLVGSIALVLLNTQGFFAKKNAPVVSLTLAMVFFFFFRQLQYVYTRKNGSYNMGVVWG